MDKAEQLFLKSLKWHGMLQLNTGKYRQGMSLPKHTVQRDSRGPATLCISVGGKAKAGCTCTKGQETSLLPYRASGSPAQQQEHPSGLYRSAEVVLDPSMPQGEN